MAVLQSSGVKPILTFLSTIDVEELDEMAITEALDYAIPSSWTRTFVFATGFKAGYRKAEENKA